MNNPRKHTSKIRQQLESSGDKVRRARLPKRMRVAMKISDAIDALDWDNKDLADKLGKYQSQITKWLKGDHNFTIDTLSDIEEILGIRLLSLDEPYVSSVTAMNVLPNTTVDSGALTEIPKQASRYSIVANELKAVRV